MDAPKTIDEFYVFKVGNMWAYFKSQHFSFWMICCYLFFEFVRPQAIFPAIDFLPWATVFILAALIGMFTDPTIKHVKSAANIYIIFFSLFIAISTLTAYWPEISRKYFMDFFSWVIIYFLITRIVNTKERFYIFLLIFLFAAGKIAIGTSKTWALRGFSFTSWGLMGPKGFFQNSGELSILMVMLFPLAFYLYQYFKKNAVLWERILLILFWVCPILTVLGASSRGSQLALALIMMIMFRKSIFKLKPLIGVIILVFSLIYLLPDEQKERLSNSGEDKTSEQRLLYWQNGWDMIKDHPFAGVGFFNFIPYFNRYYPNDALYGGAELPHNIFIQVGTDAGFPALLVFILIIFYCIWRTIKIYKIHKADSFEGKVAAGLGYGVLGFLFAGQFVTVSYYPFIWIHLSFIVCLFNVTRNFKSW